MNWMVALYCEVKSFLNYDKYEFSLMKNWSYFLFLPVLLFPPQGLSQDTVTLKISITPLTSKVYVHQSYKILDGEPFPSNGLIIATTENVILVDAAWDNSQTEQMLKWIDSNLGKKVGLAIISHSHDDRIGGIKTLQAAGVRVISTKQTADRAEKDGFPRPEAIIPMRDSSFVIGKTSMETFYPGKGHSPDNIVVWLPGQKVLFGGCLVKSTEAAGLGNTADASLDDWPATIQKLVEKYKDALFIIPGHQGWKGDPLKHTLQLLKNRSQ